MNIKKALATTTAAAALFFTAATVQAETDTSFYGRISTGISIPSLIEVEDYGFTGKMDTDNSRILSFAAGVTVDKIHDFEFEYTNTGYDVNGFSALGLDFGLSGEFKADSYMFNYRYNFLQEDSKWTPYVMGGIGFTQAEYTGGMMSINGYHAYSAGGDDTSFTWQVGVGTKYAINDKWYLDASYRYVNPQELTIAGENYNYNASNIQVGIGFTF